MKNKSFISINNLKIGFSIGVLIFLVMVLIDANINPDVESDNDIEPKLKLETQLNQNTQLPKFLRENLVGNYVRIDKSFLKSAIAAGIPNKISYQASEIFESLIDFSREIHQGDEFFVIYEVNAEGHQTFNPIKIIAAEMVNKGNSYQAILHTTKDGRDIYLSPEGKSLELAFLKSPIKFSKVSSEFSMSRFHPILKELRSHKGIDYAAAAGTEVRAVADGRISHVGYSGGYGKLVAIKHSNAKETRYGHLSAYSNNIKPGENVTKGQVIGYVGMTGLATAPHLHFEFIDHGQHLNPRKMPTDLTKASIQGPNASFFSHVSEKIQLLDQIKVNSNI